MRLAGPLHPENDHIVGQAFLVGRLQERVRRRVEAERKRVVTKLLAAPHAGIICNGVEERHDIAVEAIRESVKDGRVTVYLHGRPTNADVLRYLEGNRMVEADLVSKPSFLMLPASVVWPRGRPDPTQMLEFVTEIQSLQNRLGAKRIQIISDVGRSTFKDGRMDAVLALEEWWNRARPGRVRLACLNEPEDLEGIDEAKWRRLHGTSAR